MPVTDQSVDLITFAGSLSYADFDKTVRELCRVCRPNALIMPYDFNVLIDDLLRRFGIVESATDPPYNHAANFSDAAALKEILVKRDRIEFGVSPTDVAHILLADHDRHAVFVDLYKSTSPLMALTKDIASSDKRITLSAEIFLSLYTPVHAPCNS